ncbi:MAG: S8 family serine peptidase [Nanoarchaeota archaeon]
MYKKRRVILILVICLFILLLLSLSIVSAFSFSELWSKITGEITGNAEAGEQIFTPILAYSRDINANLREVTRTSGKYIGTKYMVFSGSYTTNNDPTYDFAYYTWENGEDSNKAGYVVKQEDVLQFDTSYNSADGKKGCGIEIDFVGGDNLRLTKHKDQNDSAANKENPGSAGVMYRRLVNISDMAGKTIKRIDVAYTYDRTLAGSTGKFYCQFDNIKIISKKPAGENLEISIATLKDNYAVGEHIQLTDPPEEVEENKVNQITGKIIIDNIETQNNQINPVSNQYESVNRLANEYDYYNNFVTRDVTDSEGRIINQEQAQQLNFKGYIVEFETLPIIVKEKQLKEQAEKNAKSIKRIFPGTLTPNKVSGKVQAYSKTIKSDNEKIKLRLINKIQEKRGISISGNFIANIINKITGKAASSNSEEVKILNEYKNVLSGIALDISTQEAKEIEKIKGVKRVSPNYEVHATLMDSVPLINADDVWRLDADGNNCATSGKECLTGKGVTIAIIDTGVDYTHPDLGGCFLNTIDNTTDNKMCNINGNCDNLEFTTFLDKLESVKFSGKDYTFYVSEIGSNFISGVITEINTGYYRTFVLDESKSYFLADLNLIIYIKQVNPIDNYGVFILGENVIDCSSDCASVSSGDCKVVGGYDFVSYDNDPMDDQGHGTHVAATVAGNGDWDKDGVVEQGEGLNGVAPDAEIYAYKVLDSGGSGNRDQILAGIERAVDLNNDGDPSDHVDIISMSLGGYGNPDDLMSKAVDNAVNAGIVAVIAAGNDGPGEQTIGSPGTARKAITVGATNKKDQIAGFSSRGPVIWGDEQGNEKAIIKPDVTAPGVDICAAQYDSAWDDRKCFDDKHIAISGTSMATPHVAGAVALLKQKNPDWTPDEIKAALKNTAVNIGEEMTVQGYGRIDVAEAINLNSPPEMPWDFYIYTDRLINNIYDLVVIKGVFPQDYDYLVVEYKKEGDITWKSDGITITGINGLIAEFNLEEIIVETGYYKFKATISKNGIEKTSITKVYFDKDLKKGFPIESESSIHTSPILSDINNDGIDEIIFVTTSGKINVYSYKNNQPSLLWSQTTKLQYTPLIVDFDGDGFKDIISGDFAWDYKGNLLPGWPIDWGEVDMPIYFLKGMYVNDINNDLKKDIIFVGRVFQRDTSKMYIFDNDLSLLFESPTINGQITGSVIAVDLNSDGNKEIFFSVQRSLSLGAYASIYGYDNKGNLLPGWPIDLRFELSSYNTGRNAIADIDGDGNRELILVKDIGKGGDTENLLIFGFEGIEKAFYTRDVFGSDISLALGNLNDDFLLDYVVGTNNPRIVYSNGKIVSFPMLCNTFVFSWGGGGYFREFPNGVVLADVDNDKKQEILLINMCGDVHIIELDGHEIQGFPKSLDAYSFSTPSVGNIDGDSNLEVVVSTVDSKRSLYAWDLPMSSTLSTMDWPMFQHDPQHTGCYDCEQIISNIGQKWKLYTKGYSFGSAWDTIPTPDNTANLYFSNPAVIDDSVNLIRTDSPATIPAVYKLETFFKPNTNSFTIDITHDDGFSLWVKDVESNTRTLVCQEKGISGIPQDSRKKTCVFNLQAGKWYLVEAYLYNAQTKVRFTTSMPLSDFGEINHQYTPPTLTRPQSKIVNNGDRDVTGVLKIRFEKNIGGDNWEIYGAHVIIQDNNAVVPANGLLKLDNYFNNMGSNIDVPGKYRVYASFEPQGGQIINVDWEFNVL